MRAHVEETVLGLFLWPEGRFTFASELRARRRSTDYMPPEYELGRADLDAREILMEGMRRLDEWTRIVKVLPSDEVQLHALGPGRRSADPRGDRGASRAADAGRSCSRSRATRASRCASSCSARSSAGSSPSRRRAPRRRRARSGRRAARRRWRTWCRRREAMVDEGQHDEAAALLRSALALDPFRADARALLRAVARRRSWRRSTRQLPREQVPRVACRRRGCGACRCRRASGACSSHVNGRWDVAALALTTGVGELETLRALRRLVHAGVRVVAF